MNDSTRANLKRNIIIAAVVFVVILLVVSVFFIRFESRNEYGDDVTIRNLGEYTRGNPSNDDRLDYIKHALYTAINLNSDGAIDGRSVSDVLVRDGTYRQEYNSETDVHTVSFIVDIESLQQSFQVSYQWSGSGEYSEYLDEWGTVVRCLDVDQLIYGSFSCRDIFTELAGPTDEKLENILPHTTTYYDIRYFMEGGEPVISIVIQSNTNTEETMNRFLGYKDVALDWLTSQGVDPNQYEIRYRNIFNRGVIVEPQGE